MQCTQCHNDRKGVITRLDVDVLARICIAFHCKIEELLEFVPFDEPADESFSPYLPCQKKRTSRPAPRENGAKDQKRAELAAQRGEYRRKNKTPIYSRAPLC